MEKLDSTEAALSQMPALSFARLRSAWECHSLRKQIQNLRHIWQESIAMASASPVTQLDMEPRRAWSGGDNWIFDLGDGNALITNRDTLEAKPAAAIRVCFAAANLQWTHLSGEPVPTSTLEVEWDLGPAVFRLEGDDPAASLHAFQNGRFLLQAA